MGIESKGDEAKASGVGWEDASEQMGEYKTPVFLSYPKPFDNRQRTFVQTLSKHLSERGFAPRTLGVTDYNNRAPLQAVRKIMLESYGLITVAFRRTYLEKATGNYRTDIDSLEPYDLSNTWITSPWAHIEPAMAYQIGLPIMILRELGVVADGVLDKGVVGQYMPAFDLEDDTSDYLQSREWWHLMRDWEGDVRAAENHRAEPPRLY